MAQFKRLNKKTRQPRFFNPVFSTPFFLKMAKTQNKTPAYSRKMWCILTIWLIKSKVFGYEWVKTCKNSEKLDVDKLYSDKVLKTYCKMLQVHRKHTLGLPLSKLCTIYKLVNHRNINCYFGEKVENILGTQQEKTQKTPDGFLDKIYSILTVILLLFLIYKVMPVIEKLVTSITVNYNERRSIVRSRVDGTKLSEHSSNSGIKNDQGSNIGVKHANSASAACIEATSALIVESASSKPGNSGKTESGIVSVMAEAPPKNGSALKSSPIAG